MIQRRTYGSFLSIHPHKRITDSIPCQARSSNSSNINSGDPRRAPTTARRMADPTPPLGPSVTKAPSSIGDRRIGKAKSSKTNLPHMPCVKSTQKQQTAGKQQGGEIHDPMGRHPQRSERQDIYSISSRIQVLCRIHMHSNRRKTRRVPHHFINAYRRLVIELGAHPKTLRTDQGTEYLNKEMTAAVNEHFRNGPAEHAVHTIRSG